MPASSARRYAQVVFQIAKEQNKTAQWQQDLRAIAVLASQKDGARLLRSPRLPAATKQTLLREALGGAQADAANLALFLVTQGRLESLARPLSLEYDRMLDDDQGIVRSIVTTAVALDSAQQQDIAAQLSRVSGKNVQMEHRVDPDIIGGMVIRIGDRIIDGSVRSKLRGLRRNLTEAASGS